ncbi:MAG: hypothetical protein AW07_02888 [Candidatus Accumulibacter sp. SK-11]|nr:MAG: hypothetical protein AW07_02888 [Candidatus Accumulibacter sp. SK-11]
MAQTGRRAAGWTVNEVPTQKKTSALTLRASAAAKTSSSSISPNMTRSGRTGAPQSGQAKGSLAVWSQPAT